MDEKTINPSAQGPDLQYERGEDFESLYANNIRFENSVWDLKMIFGEIDQSNPTLVVRQHTSISIPWIQAKLLAYFIEVNIGIFEADNGQIKVPMTVTPPLPGSLVTSDDPNPILGAYVKYFTVLHNRFFPDAVSNTAPQSGGQEDQAGAGDDQP